MYYIYNTYYLYKLKYLFIAIIKIKIIFMNNYNKKILIKIL